MVATELGSITFEPVTREHLKLLEEWMQDPESRAGVGGILPLDSWLEFVTGNDGQFARIVLDGAEPVGMVIVGLEDGEAAVALLVAPEKRGRGYGKQILRELVHQPEVASARVFLAPIEPEHAASRKCFEAVGFRQEGIEDGFLLYRWRPGDER